MTARRRALVAAFTAAAFVITLAFLLAPIAVDRGGSGLASTPSAPAANDGRGPQSSNDPADARGSSGGGGGVGEVPPVPESAGPPPPVEYVPLVTGPLPPTAATEGELVAGFPAKVPIYDDSDIVTSSVSSEGDRMQAAFDAEVDATPQAVLDFYVARFGELGLVGSHSAAVGGSRALSFVRQNESLVVTVSESGGRTRYTVSGTFTTAKG